MKRDRSHHEAQSLILSADQPLIGVLTSEDGHQVVRYFAPDSDAGQGASSEETLQAALAVIGAWSDLDWEEFSSELDRIRRESQPMPPISLD